MLVQNNAKIQGNVHKSRSQGYGSEQKRKISHVILHSSLMLAFIIVLVLYVEKF